MASGGRVSGRVQCVKAAFKERYLRRGVGQRDGGAIAFSGVAVTAKAGQQVGAAGMKRLVAGEFAFRFDRVQQGQTGLWLSA